MFSFSGESGNVGVVAEKMWVYYLLYCVLVRMGA